METISITCNGIQFFQIEKCIRKMFAAMKRPSGRKQYTEGMRDLFILMFRCTNGRDFTYLSLKRMEEELAVHPRTVERWLKKFIEDGWIAKGAEFVDGYMRHGFFLLAHPTLLKVLNNITGILLKKQAKNESENRQVVGNLPAHLTIRSSNEPTPPLPPSSPHAKEFASDIDPNKERKQINQDLFTQDETDCHPIWIQARSKLVQKNPHHSGILQLFTGRLTPSGLVVEGPNPIIINMVERNMGQEIGEVMQELGISSVSFGIQPAEIIKKREAIALQQEQLRQEKLEREKAINTARSAAAEAARLNRLSPEQQFAVVAAAYPRKSVYGERFAKKTFFRLLQCGRLPDLASLLRILNQHKSVVVK